MEPKKERKAAKEPKAEKRTSRTPIPYEYFNATEHVPGEEPMLQPETIRRMLIALMRDMDEEGVEKMTNYVVYLITKVRDLSDQNARLRAGRPKQDGDGRGGLEPANV
ncbi:MAG: hypothetical protein OXI27_01725 [Thaumarchaeota archaeon]|nr:hypothetical protein [Nitrososphaerota archaeon]